ncbi:hypothetical protein [Moorena producens]|uniref:hypothetical protein n=1 Tax=Moorena producens TaxID=1155739 RepID=UPI003C714ED0
MLRCCFYSQKLSSVYRSYEVQYFLTLIPCIVQRIAILYCLFSFLCALFPTLLIKAG